MRSCSSGYTPPAVVVNDRLEIIRFRGQTEPYLRHVPGKATLDLLAMASEELAVHLGAAIADARRSGEPVARRDLPLRVGERDELLTIHVVPLAAPGDELYFVVLFEAVPRRDGRQAGRRARTRRAARRAAYGGARARRHARLPAER